MLFGKAVHHHRNYSLRQPYVGSQKCTVLEGYFMVWLWYG